MVMEINNFKIVKINYLDAMSIKLKDSAPIFIEKKHEHNKDNLIHLHLLLAKLKFLL